MTRNYTKGNSVSRFLTQRRGECKLYKGITNYIYDKYWGSTNHICNKYWGSTNTGEYLLYSIPVLNKGFFPLLKPR